MSEQKLEAEVLRQAGIDTWKDKARKDPNVKAWFDEQKKVHSDIKETDPAEYMNNTPKDNYDYEKAINAGVSPKFEKKHNQYRWDDIGKGKNHPNLDNKN